MLGQDAKGNSICHEVVMLAFCSSLVCLLLGIYTSNDTKYNFFPISYSLSFRLGFGVFACCAWFHHVFAPLVALVLVEHAKYL